MRTSALPLLTAASLLCMGVFAQAQNVITVPGDPVELVNGVNDGDANSGPPPAAEGVEHAIDGVTQKYLNFLDLGRSEERRVGKECRLLCRSRWSPYH